MFQANLCKIEKMSGQKCPSIWVGISSTYSTQNDLEHNYFGLNFGICRYTLLYGLFSPFDLITLSPQQTKLANSGPWFELRASLFQNLKIYSINEDTALLCSTLFLSVLIFYLVICLSLVVLLVVVDGVPGQAVSLLVELDRAVGDVWKGQGPLESAPFWGGRALFQ